MTALTSVDMPRSDAPSPARTVAGADVWADGWVSASDAAERGRHMRDRLPHAAHADVTSVPDRPTIADFLAARAHGRLPELLPLGHGRMAASPFAFFRGSAGLMACALQDDAVTGLNAQICGDAHAANFGLYGTHDGRIVMDLNDFDETVEGPWEWDLKRLAVSIVLAGRSGDGVEEKAARKAARHAARAYRDTMEHLAGLPFVEAWWALGDESAIERADADELFDDFKRAARKAVRNTSERAAAKMTVRDEHGHWRFKSEPPILAPVDDSLEAAILDSLGEYQRTLRGSGRRLVRAYRPLDVATRIVGTGSVGMRAYAVLLEGNTDEALILQVKQAGPSALAPYLPPQPAVHDGERIVEGARLVQSVTDPLFGWTTIGGVPYVVRQLRNRKGSIDPTLLTGDHLDDYARLAGSLLARAHSRTVDPRVLAAYLDDGKDFDAAVGEYAMAYADVVESDHAQLLELISDGVVDAEFEDA